MMIIYYAHPKSWYGTEREKADVKFLSTFGKITNPNSEEWESAVQRAQRNGDTVMQIFADYIKEWADVVAYRSFDDEMVGAGVAREVLEANIWGKKLWKLVGRHPNISRVVFDSSTILTVEETKRRIKEGIL